MTAAWDDADVAYAEKLLKIGADPNYKAPFLVSSRIAPSSMAALG